jgi:inhibitor of KinA
MRFEPLGDQAVMAYCDDEKQALVLAAQVRRLQPPWLIDVVQAYVSVAIFYDLGSSDFAEAAAWLNSVLSGNTADAGQTVGRSHVIPCCYEFGLDFERIEQHTGLKREEIITLHAQTIYTVYAIGFCPGFPYLGYLPADLTGVPRLASPRLEVAVGSIGLTGRQTGIYTEPRPGGWNIVGKTPLQLVDVRDGYFPLRTGDEVQFRRIDALEFHRRQGERLSVENPKCEIRNPKQNPIPKSQ